jgi:hypothetical protein
VSRDYAGTSGGGAIVLLANATAGTFAEINGTIRVNALAAVTAQSGDTSFTGGGGSGGSIAIEASVLLGSSSGLLQANGGQGGVSVQYGRHAGSGSGGRISVNAASTSFAGSVQAFGGVAAGGQAAGAAGTVFWSTGANRATRLRRLIIDNANRSGGNAVLTDANREVYAFDVVTVSNVGRLAWKPASTALSTPSSLVVTSLVGDAASSGRVSIDALTVLVLPSTYTIRGMQVVVTGTLSGASTLTLDGAATLTLPSTARTMGQSAGVLSFSSVTLRGDSLLSGTALARMSVNSLITVLDTSRIVLNTLSGFVLTVATLDLSSTSSLTFSGQWTLETTTSLLMRPGSVISGDSGGNVAGVGCGSGSQQSGGSYGGFGSIGNTGGSAMPPVSRRPGYEHVFRVGCDT